MTLLVFDQSAGLTPMHKGGSQSYRDEFAGFTQNIRVTFTPAFETLSGLFCSTVLKSELGTSMLSTSPLPFWLFYYPGVGKEPGGMDGGNGVPTSFNPVRKRECPQKTAVPATLETEVLIFENNPPPPPRFCLVFQRHHTEIYDAAQLLIWFIAKSQIGLSKVMVNRQLAPGRQLVPGSLS